MNVSVPTWHSILYHFLRFTPLLAAPAVLNLHGIAPDTAFHVVEQIITIVVILMLWNLSEGALILWFQAARQKSEKARGYGLVAAIIALITLMVLPLYRAKCSQTAFVLLLTTLAMRGVARSAWEQQRAVTALPASAAGHILLSLLSFLTFKESLPWQSTVVAVSIGSALTTCELGWNRFSCGALFRIRGILPALRVLFFLGPVCIATLAFMGQLSQLYLLVLICLVWSQRAAQRITAQRSLEVMTFPASAGSYIFFMGMIAACTAFLANKGG
jgi:hypothetical protein